MSRCAIYARYSSEKQNAASTDDQIRKCREFAARKGWTVSEEHIYVDAAISGATANRDALTRMMTAAAVISPQFDCLLVDDSSRLSRDLGDSDRIIKRLKFYGLKVCFVSQGFDSESESAGMLAAIFGGINEQYLVDLSKKTRRGVEGRALKGFHTGGRVFGYRRVPIESKTERDSHGRPVIEAVRLEVDSAQAATIRRIFERYAAGQSMRRIACDLNADGIASPQPQKGRISQSWCQSAVHHILHAERYTGRVSWGKVKKIRNPETGKRVWRRRPESEWCKTNLPEQRIITDKLWNATQARMRTMHEVFGVGPNNGLRSGRAAGSRYLFTGLLRCSLCGGSVTIVSGKAGNREDLRYGCSMHAQRGSAVCLNQVLIYRRALEEQLLAGLQAKVLSPEALDRTLTRVQAAIEKKLNAPQPDNRKLEQVKAEIERRIANCTGAVADGQPSRFLLAKLAELEQELNAVTRQLAGEKPGEAKSDLSDVRKFVEARLQDLRKLLSAEQTVAEARAAISNHVQRITLTPQGKAFVASGEWDLLGKSDVNLAVTMVPGARIELATPAFSGRRSTNELPWHCMRSKNCRVHAPKCQFVGAASFSRIQKLATPKKSHPAQNERECQGAVKQGCQ